MIPAGITFVSPWVLAALALLPVLWWLLRVTPPMPRSERFPAIRLLLGLHAPEETPARTPWWLLLLRVVITALVIVGLARPVLDAGSTLPGDGPLLLVIDNGWASATGWPQRMQAATAVLDRAERAGRSGALLTTAPDDSGAAPAISAILPISDLRARVGALVPRPWPPDRAAAAKALAAWQQPGSAVAYVADGITDGAEYAAFADALGKAGPVTAFCCASQPARMLQPPDSQSEKMVVRLAQAAWPTATTSAVLAQSGDGRTLARASIVLPANQTTGTADIVLPLEVRNRLARLVLDGAPSAGSVLLLDERWRRRPVGLVAGDNGNADTPFAGALFYLRRALGPFAELRVADTATLLKRDLSVIILADRPLPAGAERDALAAWVKKGGLLIRFAGPRTAEAPIGEADTLMPVKLLGGDRQLGGALSWTEPARLAPFKGESPFAGLALPDDVRVNRQVLAEPGAGLAEHSWASLADGTPLVTAAPSGGGRIVLFHVTANADWSNLPLSGLYVDMLRRLVAVSAGVAAEGTTAPLAPAETLDGFGQATAPPRAATALAGDAFGHTPVSPRHPPGLYGPESDRHALNLGAAVPPPETAPVIAGARVEPLDSITPEREAGPWLICLAALLLAADQVIALGLRGYLRRGVAVSAVVLALWLPAPARALETEPNPALATRLGYILSGDPRVDDIARAGLEGLSEYVNCRTSATLVTPDPIEPGRTDMSFYPLLYWPIVADAPALTAPQAAALNDYMSHGGVLLIDTREAGSGAGFAPGTDAALRRVAQGLVIPRLTALTGDHVLGRAFYLLSDFPGRYTGDTVWVQRDQDRANDSVSPVIIGGNDWAAAWAVDASGQNPYAVIPGGQRQRTLAYRFGVNVVMYALTGNYKGDQVHVPAILQRLGQ
jgi:Domain of unknown function (DUF4159)/Aerotolerance regulator N-terminal